MHVSDFYIFFEILSSEKNFLNLLSLIEIRPEDEERQEHCRHSRFYLLALLVDWLP